MSEELKQEALHEALASALEIPDGAILTGWCLAYEYRDGDSVAAGAIHGPATLTTWNAIGLLEWARMCVNDAVEDTEED